MVNQLLQTNDLAYMRSEVKLVMPDTVDIQRMSQEGDGQGGFITAWASAYQNIPARLSITNSSESLTAGILNARSQFLLTVASDQSIQETDRVLHLGDTYEVESVSDGKSWQLTTQCQMHKL